MSEAERAVGSPRRRRTGVDREKHSIADEEQSRIPRLVPCTIHDVFSHTNSYLVRTPGGDSYQAVRLHDCSGTPMGARDIGHHQIGDEVICFFPLGASYGYIIAAVNEPLFDGRFVLPDSLVMRSRVGLFEDQMHRTPYENDKNQMLNFSGGRPVDTLQGDWGKINELGVAIWLGKLMTQMRASDIAKIEAFWGDDLVRIFGYNLDVLTAGRERHKFDDEGEYDEVDRWTPYIWEALGAYEAGIEVFTENDGDAGGITRGQEKSRFEPVEDEKQDMVFRGQTLRGYLGDGSRSQIALPPYDGTGIAKVDDGKYPRGVLDIIHGLDGRFGVRSAKEIFLEKSLIIPVPRRLLMPDDPSGDTATGDDPNYKPANQYGDGPTQEKKPYEWSDDTRPDVRITELWEFGAYVTGQFGYQVVDAHEKDWETAEEADLKIDSGTVNEIDPAVYARLEHTFSQELPQYGEVTIDQRDGYDVRYYRTRSCLRLLDDGSVLIEDGYGSNIFMSGGNIHMSCPGDIFQRPGRSLLTWAPRDIVMRAGYCAELTAAKKDVRIKGEQNVHLLANGSKSTVLIECRASGTAQKSGWQGNVGEDIEDRGIIVKGEDTSINLWTKSLFGGIHEDGAGTVEFNAGTGQATLAGQKVGIEALSLYSIMVGQDRSRTSQPPQFAMNAGSAIYRTAIDLVGDFRTWPGSKGSGSVKVGGQLEVKSTIQTEGVCIANGHFISQQGGEVSDDADYEFTPSPPGEGQRLESEADTVKDQIFGEFDESAFDSSNESPGNQEVWNAVGFSFRTTEQYKLDNLFQVHESRWQQMYRVFGSKTTWDEPTVDAPDGTETLPHPGKAAWDDEDHYNYIDPDDTKNVDLSKGQGKTREDQSETGADSTASKLSDEYVINIQE